jgi:hypothetical protein
LFFILPAPIWLQPRDPLYIVEVDCEDVGKLFDTEWTDGHNEALQYASSVISIWLLDLPQHTLVCLVQRFRQFVKKAPDARWKTVPQDFQLTEHPTEPVRQI